jgi:hypothetical protein
MKTNPSYVSVFIALILAAVVSITLIAKTLSKASSFSFEITTQSSAQGYAQIFYDIGDGFRETDSACVLIAKSSTPAVNRFPIPNVNYRALRFDPTNREATVTFSGAEILDSSGKVIEFLSASHPSRPAGQFIEDRRRIRTNDNLCWHSFKIFRAVVSA